MEEESIEVRLAVLEAIYRIGGPKAVSILTQLCEDEDKAFAVRARQLLYDLFDQSEEKPSDSSRG